VITIMENSLPDTNPRGIPRTPFIANIEEFMKNQESADVVLKRMQDNYSKYKFMEMSLTKSKQNLHNKIPEIKSTLEMVKLLKGKQESGETLQTHFELSDNLFTSASVQPSIVYLWLGANVMVEYSFEEAIFLLTNNVVNAEKNLDNLKEDLDFLKDQITTTEVNIARIFNFDVKQRRQKKISVV